MSLMPEISFVLPHWLYWSGLVVFPLMAMYFFRRTSGQQGETVLSLPLAYFLLLLGGFVGVHRMYVRSFWALAFMAIFVSILVVNVEIRTARDELSSADNAVSLLESKIRRADKKLDKAEQRLSRHDNERNRNRIEEAKQKLEELKASKQALLDGVTRAEANSSQWDKIAATLGYIMILLLLVDLFLLPGLVRRCRENEAGPLPEVFECPACEVEVAVSDIKESFAFSRWMARLNILVGEFVAYWSIIAVFVYYYEVIVRYVFNSPTNWAHEGMFLMFGMQYLLAGGFCLRENAHVRVDVIYMHFSRKTKALVDVITSTFFFIFVITLLVTGWIFFNDSFSINEVSFTEWGIQYYPIKFALPLGAALILLQGIARLMEDIHTLLYDSDDPDIGLSDSPAARVTYGD
jgi:TRAP-type mannitol/chloroaromatic compound transport system permease small subunit